MSARKKWAVRLMTGGGFRDYRAASKADAYRRVNAARYEAEQGLSRVSAIIVRVDEGTGVGWETYERLPTSRAAAS